MWSRARVEGKVVHKQKNMPVPAVCRAHAQANMAVQAIRQQAFPACVPPAIFTKFSLHRACVNSLGAWVMARAADRPPDMALAPNWASIMAARERW